MFTHSVYAIVCTWHFKCHYDSYNLAQIRMHNNLPTIDTKSNPNPNPNPNPTTKQHAIVNIQLNSHTPTYPDKFIRDMLLQCLYYFSL